MRRKLKRSDGNTTTTANSNSNSNVNSVNRSSSSSSTAATGRNSTIGKALHLPADALHWERGGETGDEGLGGEGEGVDRDGEEGEDKDDRGGPLTGTKDQPPLLDAHGDRLVTLLSLSADHVTPFAVTKGRLVLTAHHLSFYPSLESDASLEHSNSTTTVTATSTSTSTSTSTNNTNTHSSSDTLSFQPEEKHWPISEIQQILRRRYQLRPSALEVFFVDRTNVFLQVGRRERVKLIKKIVELKPSNLQDPTARSPAEYLRKSGLTQKWIKRQISNFDYLMALNTIAGRTNNDLTQYPVFPWIIADYTSERLDLAAPETYRNLSLPVGALNPTRLEGFLDRYESFDPAVSDIPPFHYGSHYSSEGIVLFYLIRLEPFTSLSRLLQGGRFDTADRLFHSIPDAFHSSLHSTSDVKELIPEFFYLPEFLENINRVELGAKMDGTRLNDVVLPPWAKSFEEFVHINRQALESDFVSAHLHEWIDLIFGYKQQGEAAVQAANVFYYLTYEGAVDIEKLEDPALRDATVDQISHFGQTPSQLMRKAHPKRLPLSDCDVASLVVHAPAWAEPLNPQPYYFQHVTKSSKDAVLFVAAGDRIITVGRDRFVGTHKWQYNHSVVGNTLPFSFEMDKYQFSRRKMGVHQVNISGTLGSNCFAVSPDEKFIFSCGYWDDSFKVASLDSLKVVCSITRHHDIVTCLALSADGRILITGSRDSTLMLWNVNMNARIPVSSEPKAILYGHDDEITCVAINSEQDIAVSGSRDGTVVVHSLRHGEYIRTITPPSSTETHCIHIVAIAPDGNIFVYSRDDLLLRLYSINGKLQKTVDCYERLQCLIGTANSAFVLTGGEKRIVTVRSSRDLSVVHKYETPEKSIRCMALSKEEKHLFLGLSDGKLLIFSLEC